MTRLEVGILAAMFGFLAGCGGDEQGEPARDGPSAAAPGWRYQRALTFVTWGEDAVAAAPFAFRTTPRGDRYEREMRGWLARGETWDAFLEESWSAPAVGGVWRVVPHGELRIAAGTAGVDGLWYESGGRQLRLEIGEAASAWHGGERERFRLLDGTMRIGPEPLAGVVVEELQVSRAPAAGEPDIVHDRFILLDGDGFALYLLHERPAGAAGADDRTAWVLAAGSAEAVREGRVEWVEVRPLEEARRDIPLHWRFDAPAAGVHGELTAIGFHRSLGLERGGRRDLEIRYTVEGWIERGGERVEVMGVARHEQR